MFHVIKKADVVLFIVLILFGAALAVPAFLWKDPGSMVKITVDGKLFGTYSLTEDRVIDVNRKGRSNKVVIKDGKVHMESASCKNQICVHTGAVSGAGRSIVCLPNRVSVTVEEEGGGVDAVSGQ